MSSMAGIGLPGRVKPRKAHAMTPYQAARIRFGVLAARHEHERGRLTPEQVEDLESMELVGWRVLDSLTAYQRECRLIAVRRFR